jgi:hypothetical protein
MLQRGMQVPFFEVTTVDGRRVEYRALWQAQNLLLVTIPRQDHSQACTASLRARMTELMAHDTAVVMTTDDVAGMPAPGVLVADRWGDIFFVGRFADDTPCFDADAILEWLRHVQMQCPECQGETR